MTPMSYSSSCLTCTFQANCLQASSGPSRNKIAFNKLLSSYSNILVQGSGVPMEPQKSFKTKLVTARPGRFSWPLTHLLGAVKAVPDICSAYRPYGQTCMIESVIQCDTSFERCMISDSDQIVTYRPTKPTRGLFCPFGRASCKASLACSLPGQVQHSEITQP